MHLTPADRTRITGSFSVVREPARPDVAAQSDPAVIATVSGMLSDIEQHGLGAVRRYAEQLDGWTGGEDFEIPADQVGARTAGLPQDLRDALDVGAERTRRFAGMQRAHLSDFEAEVIPGVVCGQRYVPVGNVGAYLPAGRFPLLASAFMTVGVARAAGVPNVVSATPPSHQGTAHPAVLYAARASGAERIFALGGVQALAAMAFGLLDGVAADMIVGAGNAFVAEAKRQLYGQVGIDVLAGPSEVAVIADETASATMVAADLLAQAEHGPSSPACLVTTSGELAAAVEVEVARQLEGLSTRDIAGAAWRDWGSIYVADSAKTAVEIMDLLAPEHLEILTADTDFYLDNLRNYGSLFLGEWSTVAYADKGMSGTNHVLPTARGARYTAGLSVTGYLKQLTYQKATRASTQAQAGPVVTISDFEGMPGHRDSAQLRLDRLGLEWPPEVASTEPLVLLPGMGCTAALWSLLDLGAESVTPVLERPSLDAEVDRLLGLLPERFALAGLSLGAIVAMALVRRAPERVTRLALLSTNPCAPTAQQLAGWAWQRRELTGSPTRALQAALLPSLLSPAVLASRPDLVDLTLGMADGLGASTYDAQLRLQATRVDERPGLARVGCPTLVVAARDDRLCSVQRHEEIAGLVPGAELVVVEDCAHLSPLEQPGLVSDHLRRWLW